LEGLKNKKHVFVEKPLCLHLEELEQIKKQQEESNSLLMVGFNRRFAPQIQKVYTLFKNLNQPVAITYRVNAGTLPKDHWIHDANVGGGRIVGEVCHFIDLVTYLANSKVRSLSANGLQGSANTNDTLVINLSFENGSVANISYFSNGNKELNKEYLEVFGSGQVAVINDFKDLNLYGKSVKNSSLSSQDKGHKQEVKTFLDAIREGKTSPIPFSEIYHSMLCTFKVQESIKAGGAQVII